jgi:hypothetical protein
MYKATAALFTLLIFLLTSCSASPSKPVLSDINVSVYSTGTSRVQPELFNVFYEQADLNTLEQWLEAAGEPETLPDNKKLNRIKTIVYFYEVEGQTVRSDGYMYVTFEDGTGYSKLVQPPAYIRDEYPYDESMNPNIIKSMGTDNWRKMGMEDRI